MVLKKLNNFDNKYAGLFLCFAIIIIIVFQFLNFSTNESNEKKCVIPNELVNNYNNYLYDLTIEKNGVVTYLSIKRYNSKYLIEKSVDNIKSTYYLHHTDLLEKASNGKYIRFRNDSIVDGIDNKLLLLDYINEVSLKGSVSEGEKLTCYNNRKLELSMCVNLDGSITLKGNAFTITYDIKETGIIKDFDVDVDLDYEEVIDTPTNEPNNDVLE